MNNIITGMCLGGTAVHGVGLIQEFICVVSSADCCCGSNPIAYKSATIAGKVMQCLALQQLASFCYKIAIPTPLSFLPIVLLAIPVLSNNNKADVIASIVDIGLSVTAKLVNGIALTHFWMLFNPAVGTAVGVALAVMSIIVITKQVQMEIAFLKMKWQHKLA